MGRNASIITRAVYLDEPMNRDTSEDHLVQIRFTRLIEELGDINSPETARRIGGFGITVKNVTITKMPDPKRLMDER